MAEVEIRNVKKIYEGGVEALRGVSLAIEKNEFFSLLGPSGCGKTTLLRIIAGLEQQDEGEVLIGGRNVDNVPPHKRGVGLVFQGTAIFPHMTVYDNISFGLRMRKYPRQEIRERVRNVLELMNMPFEKYAWKKSHQLSGGERQRVEIARSLVIEPKVLLLDEPLGPLDLKIRQKMQLELKRLQKKVGTTFIYVTHDQTEAFAMSDRIAVMEKGAVIQVGAPEEIYRRPLSRFVADFIGETNLIEGRVEEQNVFAADGLPLIRIAPEAADGLVGKHAYLAIRPERIYLSDSIDKENRFTGTVVDKTYMGPYAMLKVEIGNNLVLTVHVHEPEILQNLNLGDRVPVCWKASDSYLIER
ncbi:MAG: ABC transporter ATP-binding protein [Candidatus Caldarchaeum sp.]|jgi:spermidine/putrescine transport system ATP-binding protein|uniref:Molybdate/tungstate import ATP-binding protein WtpC n=1 Tax=Caldiarchaeum subterraneum TaxID=311458 RepID=A0A7C4I8V8_CALS0|nr:ABC transporter ATP-binding protein [Candidatus Caldarchaeales archaeon]